MRSAQPIEHFAQFRWQRRAERVRGAAVVEGEFQRRGMQEQSLQADLLAGGYEAQIPAAVVYKATWPEEKIFRCTVGTLHKTVTENA